METIVYQENHQEQDPQRKIKGLSIFGVLLIVMNLYGIGAIILMSDWWELLPVLIFFTPFNASFIIIASKRWIQRSSDAPSKIVFVAYILSIISISLLYKYAHDTNYFIDKNRGEGKSFVDGIITGDSEKYEYSKYGLVFTYPKDWNLVAQKSNGRSSSLRSTQETIIITPYGRKELHWGGEGVEGIYIAPENSFPMSDSEITRVLDDYKQGKGYFSFSYHGMETIGGKSFPYSRETGNIISDRKGSAVSVQYLFVHRGILFHARYTIFPGEERYESELLGIIKNIQFK